MSQTEIENLKESLTILAERVEELEEEKREKQNTDTDIANLKKWEAIKILRHVCDISESNISVDKNGYENTIAKEGIQEIIQFLRNEDYVNGNLDVENPSNSINRGAEA